MKTFQLKYAMDFTFSDMVNHHYFSLKCLPNTQPRQRVVSNKVRIDADYYSLSQDCFKNSLIYGYKDSGHNHLSLYVESLVEVDWTQYDTDDSLLPVFLKQTPFTQNSEEMKEYIQQMEMNFEGDAYQKALYISESLHACMTYEKGSTNIKTDAQTAFQNKKGVCQDYAHILLGFLREVGIPCRYVAGVMREEKYTHAWVEFFTKDRWYGIDPTNNLLVDDNYVIFSRGRDYHDTLVNKGIFYGMNISQQQNIEISMEEVVYD